MSLDLRDLEALLTDLRHEPEGERRTEMALEVVRLLDLADAVTELRGVARSLAHVEWSMPTGLWGAGSGCPSCGMPQASGHIAACGLGRARRWLP